MHCSSFLKTKGMQSLNRALACCYQSILRVFDECIMLCQDLRLAQQQREELTAALEGSQGDTVLLGQALEEAQALLEQMNAESEAQAAALQVSGP